MDLSLALKGVLIGLSVAAPIGPMSMLTMRRAIDRGLAAGLVSGLGIALADATYGAIAAFGLTSFSDLLIDHQRLIRIGGGIALLYIACRILQNARRPVEARPETTASHGMMRIAGTMYLLTLSNPTTILAFAAIFGGLGLSSRIELARIHLACRQRLRGFDALVATALRAPEPRTAPADANLDYPHRYCCGRRHSGNGDCLDCVRASLASYAGSSTSPSSTLSNPEVASASITP